MISQYKSELEKYYINDTHSTKEILIGEPDKVNLELYNELNHSRELISKVSRLMAAEKNKILNLEAKLLVI